MRPTAPPVAGTRLAPLISGALVLALGLQGLLPAQAREDAAPTAPTDVARRIDEAILARLSAAQLEPAEPCTDAEFLRRVTLDLCGTVPSLAEVAAFAQDRKADKRSRKVDELLSSEGYAGYWADWWYTTLTGLTPGVRMRDGDAGGRVLSGAGGDAFLAWLGDQLAANRPYTEFVTELLTATGRTDENPAAAYFARHEGNVNNAASAAARHFLGVRIQCAQCHDHIYEESWKQQDFKGMAAFFALVRQEPSPEYRELQRLRREQELRAKERGEAMPEQRPGRMPEYAGKSAEEVQRLIQGRSTMIVTERPADARTGAVGERLLRRMGDKNPEAKERLELLSVTPKFWMGPTAADVPGIPRRLLLARWITSDDNPYFAPALVNRLWGATLGRGLVSPVDDFNSFNEPSHPEVLSLLAEDFKAHRYDLKRVLRVILNTQTYQRSSRHEATEPPDPALFAVAAVRPLNIPQLYNSLVLASGADTAINRRGMQERRGTRAQVFSAFSFVFEDDEQAEEQDFSGSIPQGLFLMNGALLNGLIEADGRRAPLAAVLSEARTDGEKIEQIYLRAYGRTPTSGERQVATSFLQRAGKGSDGYEDLFWAVLNSAEFMTNH